MSCLWVQPTGLTLHGTTNIRLGCGCILNNSALSRTSFILWQYSVGNPQNRTGAVGSNYRSRLVWRQTCRLPYSRIIHTKAWLFCFTSRLCLEWGGHTLSFSLFLRRKLLFFVCGSCALFNSMQFKNRKQKHTLYRCASVLHLCQCNDGIGLPQEREAIIADLSPWKIPRLILCVISGSLSKSWSCPGGEKEKDF